MRVIVINPWDKSITEAEHNGNYRDYYGLLSGPTIEGYLDAEVNCFDIAPIGDAAGHLMFVDDNGLNSDVQAHFIFGPQGATFAGRGVIARSDGSEDEVGATMTIEAVRDAITWLPIGTEVEIGHPVIENFDTFEDMLASIEKDRKGRVPLISSQH